MDADFVQLQLITRLKLQLKRQLNIKMDIRQFMVDRDYAKQMLQLADESDDEDLILYSLQIAGQFGWLGKKPSVVKKPFFEPAKVKPEPAPEVETSRYLYGTRG
ncbi:hypothetical protein [Sulfuriferula nivalis]|uniref:Uncharacterized protein n=1 Tax=Sulfuriferula nivalis TaxID=2675298 RepID=A0A809RPA0_9PROT|nr:hypothetical protein [Sulfuriferula nivalis]BBP00651.1 hypothetical protein SFSGTM_13590 [Sulfuriferula nivalis]